MLGQKSLKTFVVLLGDLKTPKGHFKSSDPLRFQILVWNFLWHSQNICKYFNKLTLFVIWNGIFKLIGSKFNFVGELALGKKIHNSGNVCPQKDEQNYNKRAQHALVLTCCSTTT